MANEHTAMFILILANVWRGVPMLITMFLAGLQGIPYDLYEAGQIDGANGWNQFSKITLAAFNAGCYGIRHPEIYLDI